MNAILSIKPQFVEEIMAGRKIYEFRKHGFKQEVHKVFIYASSPVCRIVGEFELGSILEGSPEYIWSKTSHLSGVSKHFFDDYFGSHAIGFALEIKRFKRYNTPVNPYKVIKGFHAPQSFCYADEMTVIQETL